MPAGSLLPQPRRVLTDPAPHPPGCCRTHQLVSFLTTISSRQGGGCHPGNVSLVMNSTTMSHPRPGTDPEPSPDGSKYQTHLLEPPVSLAGAGKAPAQLSQLSEQAQAQTGQDKDSTCCMPGPLPFLKDLLPAEIKCSSKERS